MSSPEQKFADVNDLPRKSPEVRDYPTASAAEGKVKPKTPDEENNTETVITAKVLANTEDYCILEEGKPGEKSLNMVCKGTGWGVIMDSQGNISLNAAAQASGKYCGGKFQVNARGGTIQKYGGTAALEYNASETNNGESDSNKDSADATKGKIAKSEMIFGDSVTEVQGNEHIRGRNVTIDAGDVLTLLAKEKIILQAGPNGGGEISMVCGKRTLETDINEEWIKSQNSRITTEETALTFDPRGSQNLITTGHLNHRVLGDYVLSTVGVGRMIIGGGTLSVPLVTDMRTSAFNVECTVGNLSMITKVGSILSSAGVSKWPDMGGLVGGVSTKAATSMKQEATVNVDIEAQAMATFKAKGVATVESEALMTVKGAAVDIKADGIININTPGTIKLN